MHEEGSPSVPEGFFEWCKEHSIPVLGVCYGMQLICQKLGGEAREPPPRMPYPLLAIGGPCFSAVASEMGPAPEAECL